MSANRFGFTGIDKDLLGANRFADPLGTQVLWSHFGRALVPNLTEQTQIATGFYLLVCILYLYRKYRTEWIPKHEDERGMDVEAFYALAEQLFSYATFEAEQKWDLPGDRSVKFFYNDANRDRTIILFGRSRDLLDNQLGGGTWGLYRGAAIRSGILNSSGEYLSEGFYREFDTNSLKIKTNQLFELLQQAYTSPKKEAEFRIRSALSTSLSETLKQKGKNKALLRKYLIDNHQVNGYPLLRAVAEKLSSSKIENGDYRKFLTLCSRSWFKQHGKVFDDILRCENVVATMESVFRFIYGHRSEPVKKVCSKLPLDMAVVRAAFERFEKVANKPENGTASERYTLYLKEVGTSDKVQFVESLLRIHEAVVTGRGGSAWIEGEAGKLKVNVEYHENKTDELDAVPDDGWINPYYLDSLYYVDKGLK